MTTINSPAAASALSVPAASFTGSHGIDTRLSLPGGAPPAPVASFAPTQATPVFVDRIETGPQLDRLLDPYRTPAIEALQRPDAHPVPDAIRARIEEMTASTRQLTVAGLMTTAASSIVSSVKRLHQGQ